MKTKMLVVVAVLILAMLVSACGAPATQAPAAVGVLSGTPSEGVTSMGNVPETIVQTMEHGLYATGKARRDVSHQWGANGVGADELERTWFPQTNHLVVVWSTNGTEVGRLVMGTNECVQVIEGISVKLVMTDNGGDYLDLQTIKC